MLGTIFGDIVGSRFEFDNIHTKNFELINEKSFFTDDSVMTIAVEQAVLDCKGDYSLLSDCVIKRMREFGAKYPDRGYGKHFRRWLNDPNAVAYQSCGNGAAMRISSIGYVARSVDECKMLSKAVTEVTHNHKEGILGADATAVCVYLARNGYTVKQIEEYVGLHYYNLMQTVSEIRRTKCNFDVVCQETVPQAIICFLESRSYEDAIRNAVSIGGDSDTLAAIVGGIAEAYYGLPENFRQIALDKLTTELKEVYLNFEKKFIET